jgi:hypothetical protein
VDVHAAAQRPGTSTCVRTASLNRAALVRTAPLWLVGTAHCAGSTFMTAQHTPT